MENSDNSCEDPNKFLHDETLNITIVNEKTPTVHEVSSEVDEKIESVREISDETNKEK